MHFASYFLHVLFIACRWSGSGSGSGSEESARCANEQRLLVSAWYQLGARCHRDAVESRFAVLSAGN